MNIFKLYVILFFTALLTINTALACTDIRVQAKDGTVIVARSMEFALDLQSNLRTSPRGRIFTNTSPGGKPGLGWKAKYGYVFLDGMQVDAVVDGMNEAGLSIEDLFMPGFADYQTVPTGQDGQALGYMHFADWVLGNFKTVDEVRAALPALYVYAEKIPGQGDVIFPLHFAIYDASGKGLIVEFVGGKLYMYDSIGVLTNSPTYEWHKLNLNNYINLSPINPAPIVAQGVLYGATGQGFGMIGLPGDVSPPSRFVKMATMLHVALPANDAMGAVNLAEHIINNVDIPFGLVREPQANDYINESTEWVVFKDLTNKVFYYRTYNNMTLNAVLLAKLNFAENAPRLKMPIANKEAAVDLTNQFLKAKQPQ
jgi:choloylglycine hydrolase